MTNEEAIKRLDEIYMRLDFTDSHGYRIDLSTYEEALKIAIEGLEKQIQLESLAGKEYYIIPKTSKWIYKDVDVLQAIEKQIPMKVGGLACPICKWSILDRNGNKSNYCKHCGQRLEYE